MSTMSGVLASVKAAVEAIENENGSGTTKLFGHVMIGIMTDPLHAMKVRRWPMCLVSDAGGERDGANLDIRRRRVRLTVLLQDHRDDLGEWAMSELMRIDGRLEATLTENSSVATPLWLVQDGDLEAVYIEGEAPILVKSWTYELLVDSERS